MKKGEELTERVERWQRGWFELGIGEESSSPLSEGMDSHVSGGSHGSCSFKFSKRRDANLVSAMSLSLSLYVCKGKISCLPVKERAPLPQLFSDFQKWISEFRSASPLPGAYFLKLFS